MSGRIGRNPRSDASSRIASAQRPRQATFRVVVFTRTAEMVAAAGEAHFVDAAALELNRSPNAQPPTTLNNVSNATHLRRSGAT